MILRHDQESALNKVVSDVNLHRGEGVQLVPELRPKNDSQSAGLVERAHQTVEGQIRVMLSTLQDKIGAESLPCNDVFPWLVLYAGTVLNRFDVQVGSGKTPWDMLKGRKSRKDLLDYGECIWYMPVDAMDRCKIDPRRHDGVWLG